MKATTAFCLAIALLALAGPANAIFKCTTAKGVVYQDRPCPAGNASDLTIVIPTGEVAPRASGADDGATANNLRADERPNNAPRAIRTISESSVAATRRGSDAVTNGGEASLRNAPTVVEKAVPVSADQARKTDPSAKYYATEAFNTGADNTPAQMNCESPSGEKRVFYLTNGKLTSM